MNLLAKRAEFVAALNTVTDVQGYQYQPDTPRPGDAWPLWRGADRDEGQFVSGWSVAVFVPAVPREAERWIESHISDLYEAIQPVAYIDGFAAQNLSPSGQCLVITTRSE